MEEAARGSSSARHGRRAQRGSGSPPSRGPAPFMRTLRDASAARVDRHVHARGGRALGMHAVARRVMPETGGRMAPRAGEARPREPTHRAVAGRARIVRTADDLINVGRQTRVIEGDDAAMVRWRQPHVERRLARALADNLAKMRPLKRCRRSSGRYDARCRRFRPTTMRREASANRGVRTPPARATRRPPADSRTEVKGAITPVAPLGDGAWRPHGRACTAAHDRSRDHERAPPG